MKYPTWINNVSDSNEIKVNLLSQLSSGAELRPVSMLRTGLSPGLLISIISLAGIIEAERSRPAQFPGASLSGAEPGMSLRINWT